MRYFLIAVHDGVLNRQIQRKEGDIKKVALFFFTKKSETLPTLIWLIVVYWIQGGC